MSSTAIRRHSLIKLELFAQVLQTILDDYFFEFFSDSIIEEIKVKYGKNAAVVSASFAVFLSASIEVIDGRDSSGYHKNNMECCSTSAIGK
jgi:hypothetical protein